MTKLLICGEHNTGKTFFMQRMLSVIDSFILIDSATEEGEKSILNSNSELFDIIIKPDDVEDICTKNPEKCGIDVSYNLERYLENDSQNYLDKFLEDIEKITEFLKKNKHLSEKYVIALDEIPLSQGLLEELSKYDLIATSDESNVIKNRHISLYFNYIVNKTHIYN